MYDCDVKNSWCSMQLISHRSEKRDGHVLVDYLIAHNELHTLHTLASVAKMTPEVATRQPQDKHECPWMACICSAEEPEVYLKDCGNRIRVRAAICSNTVSIRSIKNDVFLTVEIFGNVGIFKLQRHCQASENCSTIRCINVV